MIWPFARNLEVPARRYLAACRLRPPRDRDVADTAVTVLDAETTGFRIEQDRLLSLATLSVVNREIRIDSARQWLVYQVKAPVNEAMAVHGILPCETSGGQPEKEVIREFMERIGGCLIVGHHIGFDAAMLDAALKRHYRVKLKNRILDTAALAMQELPAFRRSGYANQPPPSLEDVCAQLGIPMMDRHTASGDAFTTAEIFLTLCARMRRRLGRALRYRDLPIRRP